MNSDEIRKYITIGIESAIPGTTVIGANYPHAKPNYPYAELNITDPRIDQYGYDIVVQEQIQGDDDNVKQIANQTPEMTVSVNAYSLDEFEASDLAYKLADWFEFQSEFYLDVKSIVVIDVLSIIDRTVVIQDGFERRFGFDVRIRYTRDVERIVETINTAPVRRNV